MILCPVCNSGGAVKVGDTYACMNCGNRWEAKPQSLTYTFPWAFGTTLYLPEIHYGKVRKANKKRLVGYEVTAHGVRAKVVDYNPHSVTEYFRLDRLYETEAEAMSAKGADA